MTDDCDHDFGHTDVRDIFMLRNGSGVTTDSGLPAQIVGEVPCKKCGKHVSVDFNLSFVDGDRV